MNRENIPYHIQNKMAPERIGIVFIIDFLASREGVTGGTERQLLEIINQLDRKRFRPILFCMQELYEFKEWEKIKCEKKYLHLYSFKSILSFFKILQVIIFLRKNSIRILHTFFYDANILGVIAGKLGSVNTIITSRRDMGFWYTNRLIRMLKFLNRYTTRIMVNSEMVKENVVQMEGVPRDKIDVIMNGIDVEKISRIKAFRLSDEFGAESEGCLVVGIVANFNREVKRLDLFIKAAALVLRKNKNIKFIIIGGGKLEADLKQLAKDLGISDKVIFTGPKINAIAYIKAFDIGVICSDSEGLSNTILEYMACGVPTIATRVGGNTELIEDGKNGILVPVNDKIALADAINQFLEDRRLRIQMGQKSYQMIINNFSWKKKIVELEHYYQKQLADS